jgi:amino acid adenylation domain-containing protein
MNRHQVLIEWNDTDAELEGESLIHRLFEAQVKQTPDEVAILFEGEAWTYFELHLQAGRLARHLRRLGVGPEERVAICLDRSAEMITCILAVLKSGGTFVPLDPAYPDERLAFIIEDCAPVAVVTRSHLIGKLPPGRAFQTVILDEENTTAEAGEPLFAEIFPDNIAYVIYTSGSTGYPKGVLVPHRGAVNLALMLRRLIGVGPGTRVLQHFSFSFDGSVWDILMALGAGGTLCVAPESARLPGAALERLLVEARVNVVTLTPSLLQALPANELPDLHTVIAAGEPCTELIVESWAPGRRFFNAYGPTETTVACTIGPCQPDAGITIGRPFDNQRIYLLDPHFEPVSVGEAGEICVAGAGLARGYLSRPELTAERFIPDPLGREPGARLYRSGDLARWLPKGQIEFVGRIDREAKIRGFRIQPEEIEARLADHPDVQEAVVTVWEDSSRGKWLAAYVAGKEGASLNAASLREFLERRVPSHMIPAVFRVLDALPRTVRGKIDREALPAPESARPDLGSSYASPRTETERTLSDLWLSLFEYPSIGVDDSFLELGGHSLLATRLAARIQRVFRVDVPVRLLLEGATIASLGEWIEEALRKTGPTALALGKAPRDAEPVLSYPQERMWLSSEAGAGGAWNLPMRFQITGALDAGILERVFTEIARRHEILRTAYAWVGGRIIQEIAPPMAISLPIIDLEALEPSAGKAESQRLAAVEASHPFALERAPLLRTLLIRTAPRDGMLLVTLHHIAFDAWSVSVLINEVKALYGVFLEGKPSPLPDLPIQYRDFACCQRRWLAEGALDGQRAYWRRRLESPPSSLWPSATATASARGASLCFLLPSETARSLRQLGERQDATVFMTLLAVLDALLYRWTGQKDLVVGTDIANRNHGELEELMGFFVNVLALRVRVEHGISFLDLLGKVRETALEAYANQDLPFEEVLREMKAHRNHPPLFNVFFLTDSAAADALELPGVTITASRSISGIAVRDLALYATEVPDGISMTWSYKADLFGAAMIERLSRQFRALVAGILADPEARLDELDLLTQEERRLQEQEHEERRRKGLTRFRKITPQAVSLLDGEVTAKP